MHTQKKIIVLCSSVLLVLSALLFAKPKAASLENSTLKVVTTIFPEYDWTKQILGDRAKGVELTLLLDKGVDLHSFQPTIQDIAKVSNADIFIYVGGESDEWVEDVLKTAKNKNMIAINLLEALGNRAKNEEVIEGMEAEEEGNEDEAEFDEHVWLSLKNAQVLCAVIADALCQKDAQYAAMYRANLAAYTIHLAALDADYVAAVHSAKQKTVLFADRFPFRYLVDDYGLNYYAAFLGCSAETEASFKTIAFLASKVNELGLQNVCQIESGNGKLARTVISNSKNKKANILTFDSMQSTNARDVKKGVSYVEIMQKNLAVLQQALEAR